jgi:hypothetical protein
VTWLTPSTAAALGKLDARRTATLGGLPIGQGAWVIEIEMIISPLRERRDR